LITGQIPVWNSETGKYEASKSTTLAIEPPDNGRNHVRVRLQDTEDGF